MTENHDYATPSRGATDWHEPLNETVRQLDADAPIVDEEAAMDGYTPKEGALFLASDTGARYVGDGDGWQAIPAPTGAGDGIGGGGDDDGSSDGDGDLGPRDFAGTPGWPPNLEPVGGDVDPSSVSLSDLTVDGVSDADLRALREEIARLY